MKKRVGLIIGFSGIAVILLWSSGIIPFLSDSKVSREEREVAVSVLDKMYGAYLIGTISEARSNLENAVVFIQRNSARIPELQSSLPIAFARLSLLERTAGNEASSKVYFQKSRYWRILERENAGMKPEEIIAAHEAFTRDDSDKYVLEWDGKWDGPAYLKGNH